MSKLTHLFLTVFLILGINALKEEGQKAKVYFTKKITPDSLVTLYKKLGVKLEGNVAIKVHSGEPDGPYFLRPNFLKKIYDYVAGTFVETNAAYDGGRSSTEKHMNTAQINGWVGGNVNFQVLDEDPEKDEFLEIPNHKVIEKNIVGQHLKEYDSCLVLSHFKGHRMGGYGGALKQLSIGYGSRGGKTYIHTAGATSDPAEIWTHICDQDTFTKSMADAASSIVNYYNAKNKGGLAYINAMVNISINCDCEGKGAAVPEIENIGVLASTDPVAIDRACVDLIKKSKDCAGKEKWLKQLDNLLGENTIQYAEELGIGTQDYELIDIDEEEKEEEEEEKKEEEEEKGGDDDKKDSSGFLKFGLSLLLILGCLFI